MSPSIIPKHCKVWPVLESLAETARVTVFSGIPGAGKSLLVQQLAELATSRGRAIRTLQWDVARLAFETPRMLKRYPEIDGFTDPMIKRAVGHWARSAICTWSENNPGLDQLLIVEAPLIGDRLIELATAAPNSEPTNLAQQAQAVQPVQPDASERVLTAENTRFVVPVPSREVRRAIEAARATSIAQPRHERERSDARVNVLQAIWRDVVSLAIELGFLDKEALDTPQDTPTNYDPNTYAKVYSHLLRHRNKIILDIDVILEPTSSVYEFGIEIEELTATEAEVEASFSFLESIPI